MSRLFTVTVGAAAVSAVVSSAVLAVAPAQPVKLSPVEATKVLQEIEKDRADTQKWLQSDPTSYLATIDRRDFEQKKTLTVGRAPDNDVRIDDAAISAHQLRVTVDGDKFHVVAVDPNAHFTIVGEKDTKPAAAEKRDATVDPSSIQIGRFLLRL